MALWAVFVRRLSDQWNTQIFDDRTAALYQDLYWHLAINATSMRGLPLRDPQAVGETLNYHWLTNAHIGALARSAELDLPGLSVHAWVFAPLAALLGASFGLAHHLARSTLAGTLAAGLVVLAPAFAVNSAVRAGGFGNFQPLSPSHMLGMPVTVMLAWLVITLLSSGALRRRAAVLPLAFMIPLVAGVKVSTLPVLACGVVAAGLPLLVIRRRRGLWLGLLTAVLGALVVTTPVFGGGAGGSTFGLLLSQQGLGIWKDSGAELALRGPLGDKALLAGFIALLCLNAAVALPALLSLRLRQPAGWLLLGMITSAFGVTFVLSHPGKSEMYFPMGVQPLLAVAVAAGLVVIVRRSLSLALRDLVGTVAAGLTVGAWLSTAPPWQTLTLRGEAAALAFALLLAVAVLILATIIGMRRALALASVWLVAASSASGVLGAVNGSGFSSLSGQHVQQVAAERKPSARDVVEDEMRALRHVTELPADAVLATNVHCQEVKTSDNCDARAFWVAGIGQRPVLLGGWGYTNLGRSTQGQGGRYHVMNPYPDEQLFALNERAFQEPDDATIRALKERGVTHLFADRRASGVADLTPWCTTTFENSTVTVCALG